MDQDKYTRYQFLKSIGFKGSALVAILAACTKKEDAILEPLILNKNGQKVASLDSTNASQVVSSASNSGSSSGSSSSSGNTGGNVSASANLVGKVTTDELNSIKNYLVKLDLTSSATNALKTAGGYIITNGTVVACSSVGEYVAAQNLCTHQPRQRIVFNRTEYYCTDHGARFSLSGQGLNSLGSRGLTVYKTANDGKNLVIYL
ncbi:Rieske (2Fe-2S) protein [Aquirufa rosea]|uniref:(2Fe-2S)-binding protein n=1 Tax=Aquirufa rosea TaxID=2509241 RepID=A0A4Q1BXR8_9BACT|nr:Rieske 2Fe-2S domain-containing protein [Aquirufa rosea]RXK47508.1 (2Fe-2S)-binding protein [Aquirufa rosea]